ncbi:MAG: T9SS type A sorting domain-containing protein [Bacteroidales bacterium]
MVDGNTIISFSPEIHEYVITLPANTSTIPTVTYTLADDGSAAEITNATDLAGTGAERTTTVKVTAEDNTTIIDYTILFNPILEVENLAALRAVTDFERVYTVTGEVVVTAIVSYKNQKWIQDASAGIQIYDEFAVITTTYAVGDGITGITGTLLNYNGMLELIPYEDPGAVSSSANTVTPQVLTVAQFKTNFEDYESELVTIEDAVFAAANGTATFADGSNYVISVGADQTVLRIHFYSTSVTGTVIPATANVTGIAIWHWDEAKISPRYIEDIVIPTAAEITFAERLRIYPVPVTVDLNFDNLAGAISLDIIDMTGSRIISRNVEGQDDYSINVSQLPRGIYFVRIKTVNEVITRKFIKE